MKLKIETYNFSRKLQNSGGVSYKLDILEAKENYYQVAKPWLNHAKYSYWEAYLIPHLNIQLNRYYQHEGKHWCDAYIDIGTIEQGKDKLIFTDLFVDICVTENKSALVLDLSDFAAAIQENLLTQEQISITMKTLEQLMNSLAKHDYAVQRYLDAENIAIDWYRVGT